VTRPQLTESVSHDEIPHALLASYVTQKTLQNGLTVLVKEVYPASVVCLSVWAGVGSTYEPDNICGISHFVEHMLFKGTESRPVGKIPQEIHALGGYINGFTGYGCTCYWIVLPSRYFRTAMEIMADAVLHPLFDPQEIKKEAEVIIEEIKMYQDRPESYCFEQLMGMAFKKHRCRRPITGYEKVVAGLTADDIVDFYRHNYVPDNMAVVVVGDVRTRKAMKVVNDFFGAMEPRPFTRDEGPPEAQQRAPRKKELKGDVGTSYLHLGYHVGGILSPDMHACDLLASILGEGRSSRLHQQLREKKALVTGIDSSILALQDTGLFIIDALMEEKNISRAKKEIIKEVERIKAKGVTAYELKKAKNMVSTRYLQATRCISSPVTV